jgi:hypothetical protein
MTPRRRPPSQRIIPTVATCILCALVFLIFTLIQLPHVSILVKEEGKEQILPHLETQQPDRRHSEKHDHHHHHVIDDDDQYYLSCPRNVHIIMMGDSLMRYQYLSLVYFLRWQRWFDPNVTVNNLVNEKSWRFDDDANKNGSCRNAAGTIRSGGGIRHRQKQLKLVKDASSHRCNHTNHTVSPSSSSWNHFFRVTNQLFMANPYTQTTTATTSSSSSAAPAAAATLKPWEICDCHRHVATFRNNLKGLRSIYENRYYHDPIRNNTVMYLLALGHKTPVHGRIRPMQLLSMIQQQQRQQQPVNDEQESFFQLLGTWSNATWEYANWHDVIQHYMAPLRPDYIVLNAGLWPNHFHHAHLVHALRQTVKALASNNHNATNHHHPGPIHTMWRTTSHGRNGTTTDQIQRVDEIMCQELRRVAQQGHHHHHGNSSSSNNNNGGSTTSNSPFSCMNISWTRHISSSLYWDHVHFLEPVYRSINEEMLETMRYLQHQQREQSTTTTATTAKAITGETYRDDIDISLQDQECHVMTKVKRRDLLS